ncbi:response regulator [Thiomicrospira sp. ALE5]|uniref:response regulator n=1 Tax=Thiomicrospira sp. ALE5 TaxID=748650 RepID=UPI0008E2BA53|nr:response regulator [Thiomicrospira sp. ALE5]SFR52540.1 Response regulator receiver domain-containing protein [Thiomicrospira sp. ALE5]
MYQQPRNILLIDDDLLLQRVQLAFIESYGHQAFAVKNLAEAQEALNNRHFDLILTDIIMPEMNGFELTKKLRDDGIKLPIIALSGNGSDADRQQAKQAGMNGYLTKPLRQDAFNKVIATFF